MNPAERMSDEEVALDLDRLKVLADRAWNRGCWCNSCDSEYFESGGPKTVLTLIALVESLQREIADLRRDAERYLRIRNGPYSDRHGDVYAMIFEEEGDVPAGGEVLDAAVDLALRKGKRA